MAVLLLLAAATLAQLPGASAKVRTVHTDVTPLSTPPEGSPVALHGKLSVSGNRVVDENGSPTQLTGMSFFWSQWIGKYWNADAVDWLVDDWECSLIRCAMAVESGGYLQNPESEKAKVKTVVDAAIARGVYVVIDWHDHHAERHVNESIAFFDEMAEMYGAYPNVLFETYNEPTQIDWSTIIKPYHEMLVPVIRQHTDNLILLGTAGWCEDVEVAAADPVAGDNLAYTVHFYAASHKDFNRNRAQQALDAGVALFGSEWGTCDYSGNGTLDLDSARQWINFMKDNHISWANWAVADKRESASIINPGSAAEGGWTDAELTPSGYFIRKVLKGLDDGEEACRDTPSWPCAPPSPTPAPTPRPEGPLCCHGGCGGNCQGGWCGESRGNCEGACNGEFCPVGPQPTPGPPPPPPPPTTCSDRNQYCPDWAASGECERNPGWMQENCRLSCGVCSGPPAPPPPAPCTDNNAGCAAWAASGECEANPGWMLENCCQSCRGNSRLASLKRTKKHV